LASIDCCAATPRSTHGVGYAHPYCVAESAASFRRATAA
jgi:hypothetical protein